MLAASHGGNGFPRLGCDEVTSTDPSEHCGIEQQPGSRYAVAGLAVRLRSCA
jgi:hypothetical protein